VRYPWARDYRGAATVLYGHTPTPEPEWVNNTMCLDTGAVFGGRLTALRHPERQVVSVPAAKVWYEPVKPFPATASGAAGGAGSRPDDPVITDVLGGRGVQTRLAGRVTVREANAAGALEVMSRFALDPRRLLYLPPTMAPVATSAEGDVLEHPASAFAAYRGDGVARVLCEEKHMGSRAVVLVCRSAAAAGERFGLGDGESGVVHTRTGRAFFAPGPAGELLARLRSAVDAAGLWDELGTSWLLFDAELLPWSAKAGDLLRHQYAAVGAAARASTAAAVEALRGAAGRGLDVADLLARTSSRAGNAAAFTAAYRRYVWPTTGVDGVELAPFQLLASEGRVWSDHDHGWHLGLADRLVAAAPGFVRPTRRLAVDVGDPASVAAGVAWWEDLTAAGGEGMVVKPFANQVTGEGGGDGGRNPQPGLKVRGREYLRIVYGPDYTEPANLSRLRNRSLGHKRSLAWREYALGQEALERFVAGEPLWRVHEPVFAVLALEAEPVDPRL
jgi:protein phosphatase